MTFDDVYGSVVIVLVLLVIVLSVPVQAAVPLPCLADYFNGWWFTDWYYSLMEYATWGKLSCVK